MAVITIGNSYSHITGMSAKEEKTLKEALSYTVGGSSAYFSGYGVHRKSLLGKRGDVPTGLLHRVIGMLPAATLIRQYSAIPAMPSRQLKDVEPYEWQLNAMEIVAAHHRGTIAAVTGSGKSLLIALIAARLNVKTLVICPTLEIKKQLESLIASFKLKNVTIRNIDASDLSKLKDFGCLIIDECHHASAQTYQKLNKTAWTGIYYRYCLTATAFRNDPEEMLLFEAIAGQVIYKLEYKEAISKGYIVPVEAFYVDLPKQETYAFTYQEVYKEFVVNNVIRNNIIFSMLYSLYEHKKSALCLVKEVQHGRNIDYPAFVHGQDEESRQLIEMFNTKKIYGLVATTGIMGEGVDSKPCEYVIIAGLGRAKSAFLQQVGRAVRRYPGKETAKIIIFKDTSHKFTLRHFNEQRKILKEYYGITPQKLRLDL